MDSAGVAAYSADPPLTRLIRTMRLMTRILLCLGLLGGTSTYAASPVQVHMQTSHGDIIAELYPDKAPITVANFLAYVEKGQFNGTIFHRVIPGFMIQGGGYDALMVEREAGEPIRNEANNGLTNARGTLAMARQPDPHSARVQWFINLIDNDFLNHRTTEYSRGWGYAVFGKVVSGMDVVDAISEVDTTIRAGQRDVPVEPVVIEKVQVISASGG